MPCNPRGPVRLRCRTRSGMLTFFIMISCCLSVLRIALATSSDSHLAIDGVDCGAVLFSQQTACCRGLSQLKCMLKRADCLREADVVAVRCQISLQHTDSVSNALRFRQQLDIPGSLAPPGRPHTRVVIPYGIRPDGKDCSPYVSTIFDRCCNNELNRTHSDSSSIPTCDCYRQFSVCADDARQMWKTCKDTFLEHSFTVRPYDEMGCIPTNNVTGATGAAAFDYAGLEAYLPSSATGGPAGMSASSTGAAASNPEHTAAATGPTPPGSTFAQASTGPAALSQQAAKATGAAGQR